MGHVVQHDQIKSTKKVLPNNFHLKEKKHGMERIYPDSVIAIFLTVYL